MTCFYRPIEYLSILCWAISNSYLLGILHSFLWSSGLLLVNRLIDLSIYRHIDLSTYLPIGSLTFRLIELSSYRLIDLSIYRYTTDQPIDLSIYRLTHCSCCLCYTGIQQPIEYLSITAMLSSLSFYLCAFWPRTASEWEMCCICNRRQRKKTAYNWQAEARQCTCEWVRERKRWKGRFRQAEDVDECADTSDNTGVSSLIENLHLQSAKTKLLHPCLPHSIVLSSQLSLSLVLALSKLRQQKLLASDSCQIDVAREPKTILRHFEL